MGGRTPVFVAAFAAALVFVASASARPSVLQPHAWVWPASGTITTPFTGYHPGIDIGMLRSLDIRAATAGVVTATGYTTGFEGYGNIVLVNAGGGVQVLYAHLSRPLVRVGRHVVPGELLGIAGCTGSCTGTHLHFEVRLNGTAIDPIPYLPGGIPAAPAGPAQADAIDLARAARTLLGHLPQIPSVTWFAAPLNPPAGAVLPLAGTPLFVG